ncbi:MAG TPA: phage holin family protein, partial [Sphingomicrobium sp.]
FHAGQELKRAVIFTALAVACIIVALMALTMGAVLALTPLLGAWGATGAVVLFLLVAAGIFALIASTRLRRTARTLEGEEQ